MFSRSQSAHGSDSLLFSGLFYPSPEAVMRAAPKELGTRIGAWRA